MAAGGFLDFLCAFCDESESIKSSQQAPMYVHYTKSETATELARHSSENTLWSQPRLIRASFSRAVLKPVLVALDLGLAQLSSCVRVAALAAVVSSVA